MKRLGSVRRARTFTGKPSAARRRRAELPLSLGLALLLQVGCGKGGKDEPLEPALIQEATKGDLLEEIIESGKITPWNEVKIKGKVSGEVQKVLVDEGQAIKRGDLLMSLEDTDYRRQVALAETDYDEAVLKVKNAELELERNQSAYDARGISKYELDRAKQALELARVGMKRAEVQLATRRDQLGYTRITSPMDGIVTARNVEPGEVVTAGVTATVNGEPLLTIAELDKLRLELNLNQVDVARVQPGQKATVTLDAYRDTPIEGEVTTIAAAAHTDTAKGIDVFKIEVLIDPTKTDLKIKPGMTAEVRVHIGTYPQVVKVPVETVFEEDGKHYLYIVKSDPKQPDKQIKERIEVTLGHKGAQEVEIAQGLDAGQKIYTRGDTKDLQVKM